MFLRVKTMLIFLYFATVLQYTLAEDEKVEYKFVLDKLDKVLESDDILTTNVSFDKQGEEVVVNGEVKQLVDLDNDWKFNVVILRANEADSEYTKLMTLPEKGICDVMKSYYKMYFYQSLKNHANAPDPENCPVTKETYLIKDYPLDSSKFKKFIKPGHYRIVGTLLSKEVEKLKYEIYGHVEEVK